MRIISRCSDILVANIHVLLDRAENPETMLGQVLREMEDDLADARRHAAGAIGAERYLRRELAEQRRAIEQWQNRARAAVSAGRDELARVALMRKKELESSAAQLAIQHSTAAEASAQVLASVQAMDAALGAARCKQRSLIARYRAAQARQALGRAAGERLGQSVPPAAKLQHWEQRLADLEDIIAAEVEVQGLGAETSQAASASEADVERELAALKDENTRE